MNELIQINDRNKTYKSFDTNSNSYVFIKESIGNSENNPTWEIIPLQFFMKIDNTKCPKLIVFDSHKIMLELIENHHRMKIGSKYFVKNLESLKIFLSKNYTQNTIIYISQFPNAFRYLKSNKSKWTKRILNVIKYLNNICEKKIYRMLAEFDSDNVCLCHGDLVFSNILCDKENIILIDYEYGMLSSPEFDLSRLLSRIILYYYNDPTLPILIYFKALIQNITDNINLTKLINYIGFHIFDYCFCHKHYDSLARINNASILCPLAQELLLFERDNPNFESIQNILIHEHLIEALKNL